ncbi:MAG: M23 family metallopeptidase [Blautia sp.]|nr:M23 family metallopeptidase [Lachnoclostridium sp.]MCM1211570.1 M23 family metallopeptidase [Blautia sp.]
MKRKGHKHKESFSILLISHTGRDNRKFHISRAVLRLLVVLFVLLCAAVGLMGWMIYKIHPSGGVQKELNAQIASQEETIKQLETEKTTLGEEKQILEQENEALRAVVESAKEEETAEPEPEKESESMIPRRYPSSGISAVLSSYSEETPYLSINTHIEGNIIATGSGVIVSVTSDDTYPVIIEVEHEKGYKSRYMCRQEAEVLTSEGALVEAGDTLFTITVDDTQLDYQITFEGEPIDPLTVIEAKG